MRHRIFLESIRSRAKYGSTVSRLHAPMQGLKWRCRTGSWPRSIGSVFGSKGFAFHFVASPCLEFPARFRWIATSQKSLDTARVADIRSTVLDPLVTFIFTFRTCSFPIIKFRFKRETLVSSLQFNLYLCIFVSCIFNREKNFKIIRTRREIKSIQGN